MLTPSTSHSDTINKWHTKGVSVTQNRHSCQVTLWHALISVIHSKWHSHMGWCKTMTLTASGILIWSKPTVTVSDTLTCHHRSNTQQVTLLYVLIQDTDTHSKWCTNMHSWSILTLKASDTLALSMYQKEPCILRFSCHWSLLKRAYVRENLIYTLAELTDRPCKNVWLHWTVLLYNK